MGRGTVRSTVEGRSEAAGPSTTLRVVPLPIAFGDGEDEKNAPLICG
jgi:hypothetical protein